MFKASYELGAEIVGYAAPTATCGLSHPEASNRQLPIAKLSPHKPEKFSETLRILLPFHKSDAVKSAALGKNG
jgi:hypothetical protein